MKSKIFEAALRETAPQIYDDDDFPDILDPFNCK